MDIRLFWLALGTFAIGAEGFVVSSLLPAISADTGVTIAQGGTLVLAFALAFAFGSPILASLTGHLDRRAMLFVGMLVFTLGNVIAALAHSFEQLLAARVVMALAAGLYMATAQATAIAISDEHHRARAISVIVGGTTIAVALGAPLGALIAGFAGWRGTFATVAVVGLAVAIAIRLLLPTGLKGTRLPLAQRVAVIARPGVPAVLLVTLLPLLGAFSIFTYVVPLATRTMGLSEQLMPAVLLAFGVGAAVGNYAGGQLADRFGATRTAIAATALLAVVMAGMSVIGYLPPVLVGAAFIGMTLIWGIVGWALPPAQASRVVKLAPDAASIALSLNSSALYLGVALGSVVGGEVLTYASPSDLGWIAAIFPAVAFLLLLWRPAPSLAQARLG